MKKHELLKYAYDNYPKGTKYVNLGRSDRHECETSGKFYADKYGIRDSESHYFIYGSGKWAKIVKPKIAVKVENEKEFAALMKYYDSLGYINPLGFKKFPEDRVKKDGCLFVTFEKNYIYPHNNWQETTKHLNPAIYNQIPFADFAKEHNIKLPQTKSQDNVDLFIGDKYFVPQSKGFDCKSGYYDEPREFTVCENTHNVNQGIFSTKQAGLDWIEAQKPKSIEYVSNFGIKCQSSKDEVLLSCGCGCFSLTVKDIESIHKAMQELS